MGQGGQPLGDGPEPVQPERVHRQASERGQDLNAVGFAVAVGILTELGVAGPVPGIFNAPSVTYVLQQGLGAAPQTRVAPRGALSKDVVTGLIDALAIADALAAHRNHRGAARPVLHHPLWSGHATQRPGDIPAVPALAPAGLERRLSAVGQAIGDHLKSLAAAVFHSNHEVGAALFEVEKNDSRPKVLPLAL